MGVRRKVGRDGVRRKVGREGRWCKEEGREGRV